MRIAPPSGRGKGVGLVSLSFVHCTAIVGVVTFCRDCATPVAAEEGLTGSLSSERVDAVKCYGQWVEFSQEEVPVHTQIEGHY